MKSTGIVRNIDELGRLVIPKELREKMDMKEGTPVEIFVEGSHIAIARYYKGCHFCGATGELLEFRDKNICEKCLGELKNLV
ncbi:MAG: AbrB/MazE/SpoVT family DNA-binding domain-containing protein [Clostridia bacterium]|nr:AbrB/MazE/SpoVT family DNA-binding domain-containing protein [Clostridia bacterium]